MQMLLIYSKMSLMLTAMTLCSKHCFSRTMKTVQLSMKMWMLFSFVKHSWLQKVWQFYSLSSVRCSVNLACLVEDSRIVFSKRWKEVVVRIWPWVTVIPTFHDPEFEWWAIIQLQLYKPFWTIGELRTSNVQDMFFSHLRSSGFPHIALDCSLLIDDADKDLNEDFFLL